MSSPYNACKIGKIRNRKYRVHQSVSNPKDNVLDLETLPNIKLLENTSFKTIPSTIFKTVQIPREALQQKLPTIAVKDYELKSVIDSIKGRRRRRKIPFHEVVASAKAFIKNKEKEKKKATSNILGDLQALKEALPTVEEKNQKKDNRPRAAKSFTRQNIEMMEDIQGYQQFLIRADFNADPFNVITNILTQRIYES